ncbi:MAG TPA: glycosyltransferase family 2 protein, partial [Solirubrobacteraceae bacterium]
MTHLALNETVARASVEPRAETASSILIVVPAFDEADTIGGVVRRARRHGPVLVVDDGSTDLTPIRARAAGADVVAHGRRRGKGAALRTGLEVARRRCATLVITLDADGQHDADEIPLLLDAARRHARSIVIGGRLRLAHTMPRARLNACRTAGFFIDWLTGSSIGDTQSGFRCWPLSMLDDVDLRRDGFVLETELLVAGARAGFALVEVETRTLPPPVRPSRFRPVRDGAAIARYLAGEVMKHTLAELRSAAAEVTAPFRRTSRRARHQAMWQAMAAYSGVPSLAGLVMLAVVIRRARGRLSEWLGHPRLRRAALVAAAAAMAPLLLAAAGLQRVLSSDGIDLVTPIVRRFYSQERLAAAGEPSEKNPKLTDRE